MTPLERELTALVGGAFPETPDLASAVRARIEREPAREPRWRGHRRALVVGLAVLVVAIGAAFAVPEARSTILRWFGIGGVRIQVVERIPPVATRPVLQIGVRVSLAQAQQRIPFRILVPARSDLGPPDEIYVGHFVVDEVTLLYRQRRRVQLLLTEAVGRLDTRFAGKLVGPNTHVEELTVAGRPALWIEGAPHVFYFVAASGGVVEGSLRLARNTLLWQRREVILRLEGGLTRERALTIARASR